MKFLKITVSGRLFAKQFKIDWGLWGEGQLKLKYCLIWE